MTGGGGPCKRVCGTMGVVVLAVCVELGLSRRVGDSVVLEPLSLVDMVKGVCYSKEFLYTVRSLPRGLYAERASHTGTVADQRTQG